MSFSQNIEEVLLETVLGFENPEEQREFLELLRRGDPIQSERLAGMLAVQAKAVSFFREAEEVRTLIAAKAGAELIEGRSEDAITALTDPSEEEAPGRRIGRYRLIQRIGEGGCGVVHLAEQQEPVRRHVALKIIRLGMDTERVITRFEMERQALAMMDHPNIARVFDAGATETGRPYFVMEWVRGLRITDYCDENHLDLSQRIDLFIEVCKGIQHAHQKGVIHRDIKPSNILISDEDGKPAPKVIDFGVAKAMEEGAGADTVLTVLDQFVGTPAYMSPEQADQKSGDIDTRSDVYSLGMLLYELLAGRTPFDSKELMAAGVTEMRRIITERDPIVPSASLATSPSADLRKIATSRACEPGKLAGVLTGDLDSVIMKAIEKDRHRRYETVNGLIMDLQRYIVHEPVLALPAKRMYLFRKFVRRNRVAVGTTAGIVLALLLGLGVASTYYLRERSARQEQVRLRQVADEAHASELKRLVEAREWEYFAHISVLLSEDKTAEADEQLRQTPLTLIKLTPQSSAVLRSLGNWNALRGRWQQSVECFKMLQKADELNRDAHLTSSLDLVAIGCVLIESGASDDYAVFRNWAADRFETSSSTREISHLLHAVLLQPADAASLSRFDVLKPQFATTIQTDGGELACWRAFGLALLEYRHGNFQKARHWAEVGMKIRPNRDHINGALEPVRAMASFRLGDVKTAQADLERARKRIERAFAPELPAAYEPFGQNQGFWWDWIVVRILFREAEALIEGESEGR